MSRRAPEGGYNFPQKSLYRRHVWNFFRRVLPIHPKKAQVLLMPSSEGLEIEIAKAKGFLTKNMHVVDDNPAIVATLKRKYPNVTTYGVSASRACDRMAMAGVRLDAANFDFTACVGDSLAEELWQIGQSGILTRNTRVAITMLRGREQPVWFSKIQRHAAIFSEAPSQFSGQSVAGTVFHRTLGDCELSSMDSGRVGTASFILSYASGLLVQPIEVGAYTSNHQTMLWFVSMLIDEVTLGMKDPAGMSQSKVRYIDETLRARLQYLRDFTKEQAMV